LYELLQLTLTRVDKSGIARRKLFANIVLNQARDLTGLSSTTHTITSKRFLLRSFGYFVPGVESGGNFVRVGLEMKALARAQLVGGQEYADFFTNLGKRIM